MNQTTIIRLYQIDTTDLMQQYLNTFFDNLLQIFPVFSNLSSIFGLPNFTALIWDAIKFNIPYFTYTSTGLLTTDELYLAFIQVVNGKFMNNFLRFIQQFEKSQVYQNMLASGVFANANTEIENNTNTNENTTNNQSVSSYENPNIATTYTLDPSNTNPFSNIENINANGSTSNNSNTETKKHLRYEILLRDEILSNYEWNRLIDSFYYLWVRMW